MHLILRLVLQMRPLLAPRPFWETWAGIEPTTVYLPRDLFEQWMRP